jgi:arylsulfatase A-like enzyme
VAFVDESVGRLLEDLRQRDLYDESLIIVVGDHGEEFWEHGFTGHGHSMYQEQLHVPLMIKLPGSSVRRRINSFVPVQAVLPTVLALCGIEAEPAKGWTLPLTSLLSDGSQDEYPEPIVSGAPLYHDSIESVILENRKYIRNRHSDTEEYYDLGAGSLDQTPLSGEHLSGLDRAREALAQHAATAQHIREEYGLQTATPSASEEDLERLRSLGYIQ